MDCHTPKKNGPEGPWKEAGDPEGPPAWAHGSDRDKLPGQGDLDGIAILVQNIQPDSGTSPDVLCETMIFLAINPRQVICEEAA